MQDWFYTVPDFGPEPTLTRPNMVPQHIFGELIIKPKTTLGDPKHIVVSNTEQHYLDQLLWHDYLTSVVYAFTKKQYVEAGTILAGTIVYTAVWY